MTFAVNLTYSESNSVEIRDFRCRIVDVDTMFRFGPEKYFKESGHPDSPLPSHNSHIHTIVQFIFYFGPLRSAIIF